MTFENLFLSLELLLRRWINEEILVFQNHSLLVKSFIIFVFLVTGGVLKCSLAQCQSVMITDVLRTKKVRFISGVQSSFCAIGYVTFTELDTGRHLCKPSSHIVSLLPLPSIDFLFNEFPFWN